MCKCQLFLLEEEEDFLSHTHYGRVNFYFSLHIPDCLEAEVRQDTDIYSVLVSELSQSMPCNLTHRCLFLRCVWYLKSICKSLRILSEMPLDNNSTLLFHCRTTGQVCAFISKERWFVMGAGEGKRNYGRPT